AFASTAGLKAAVADMAIDDLVAVVSRALDHLQLPPPLSDGSQGAKMAEQMRAIVRERIEGFS
ncbi:MAG: type II toxin-antitoxin system HipA family toxin, partial [Mesorhizobium sp.]